MKTREVGHVRRKRYVEEAITSYRRRSLHMQMIEAGWYYCPTLESDDFVKCSYCSLSLDGWEPKDNP